VAKYCWCLAVTLLLCPCALRAEVDIAAGCRVKNRPPGRCGWCALETLARHHHIKVLYGLSRKHASHCSPETLEEVLADTGIRYRIQYPGDDSRAILRYAVRQGLGAVVGFREIYPGGGGHIVTLVEFTHTAVKVIDSNDQDGRTRTMRLEDFLFWWDGFALVLEPAAHYVSLEGPAQASVSTGSRGAGGRHAPEAPSAQDGGVTLPAAAAPSAVGAGPHRR